MYCFIGKNVETIGHFAFEENELTEVTIPDSVKTIGDGAFFQNKLIKVKIPDSVTTIGNSAFKNKTEVTIGKNVETIGLHNDYVYKYVHIFLYMKMNILKKEF